MKEESFKKTMVKIVSAWIICGLLILPIPNLSYGMLTGMGGDKDYNDIMDNTGGIDNGGPESAVGQKDAASKFGPNKTGGTPNSPGSSTPPPSQRSNNKGSGQETGATKSVNTPLKADSTDSSSNNIDENDVNIPDDTNIPDVDPTDIADGINDGFDDAGVKTPTDTTPDTPDYKVSQVEGSENTYKVTGPAGTDATYSGKFKVTEAGEVQFQSHQFDNLSEEDIKDPTAKLPDKVEGKVEGKFEEEVKKTKSIEVNYSETNSGNTKKVVTYKKSESDEAETLMTVTLVEKDEKLQAMDISAGETGKKGSKRFNYSKNSDSGNWEFRYKENTKVAGEEQQKSLPRIGQVGTTMIERTVIRGVEQSDGSWNTLKGKFKEEVITSVEGGGSASRFIGATLSSSLVGEATLHTPEGEKTITGISPSYFLTQDGHLSFKDDGSIQTAILCNVKEGGYINFNTLSAIAEDKGVISQEAYRNIINNLNAQQFGGPGSKGIASAILSWATKSKEIAQQITIGKVGDNFSIDNPSDVYDALGSLPGAEGKNEVKNGDWYVEFNMDQNLIDAAKSYVDTSDDFGNENIRNQWKNYLDGFKGDSYKLAAANSEVHSKYEHAPLLYLNYHNEGENGSMDAHLWYSGYGEENNSRTEYALAKQTGSEGGVKYKLQSSEQKKGKFIGVNGGNPIFREWGKSDTYVYDSNGKEYKHQSLNIQYKDTDSDEIQDKKMYSEHTVFAEPVKNGFGVPVKEVEFEYTSTYNSKDNNYSYSDNRVEKNADGKVVYSRTRKDGIMKKANGKEIITEGTDNITYRLAGKNGKLSGEKSSQFRFKYISGKKGERGYYYRNRNGGWDPVKFASRDNTGDPLKVLAKQQAGRRGRVRGAARGGLTRARRGGGRSKKLDAGTVANKVNSGVREQYINKEKEKTLDERLGPDVSPEDFSKEDAQRYALSNIGLKKSQINKFFSFDSAEKKREYLKSLGLSEEMIGKIMNLTADYAMRQYLKEKGLSAKAIDEFLKMTEKEQGEFLKDSLGWDDSKVEEVLSLTKEDAIRDFLQDADRLTEEQKEKYFSLSTARERIEYLQSLGISKEKAIEIENLTKKDAIKNYLIEEKGLPEYLAEFKLNPQKNVAKVVNILDKITAELEERGVDENFLMSKLKSEFKRGEFKKGEEKKGVKDRIDKLIDLVWDAIVNGIETEIGKVRVTTDTVDFMAEVVVDKILDKLGYIDDKSRDNRNNNIPPFEEPIW